MTSTKEQILTFILSIFIGVLLFLIGISEATTTKANKNILLLQSFNYEKLWNQKIVEGLEEYVGNNKNNNNLLVENIYDEDFISNNFLIQKYRNVSLDVIIVSDRQSFLFLKKHIGDFTSNLKQPTIIFAGLEKYEEEIVIKNRKTTGIVSGLNILGNINLIKELQPNIKKIIIIGTNKELIEMVERRMELIDQKIQIAKTLITTETEIKAASFDIANKNPKETALFFVATPIKNKNGKTITSNEILHLITQNTKMPIYSPWSFNLGFGVLAGDMVDGKEIGRVLGIIAKKSIEDNTHSHQLILHPISRKMYDYAKMKDFNLSENLIPIDAFVLNAPSRFYEIPHKTLNAGATLIAIVFIGGISVLYRLRKTSEQKIKDLAELDELTGIYNRRKMNEIMENEISRSERYKRTFSLIVLDIDFFKKVNDKFGHKKGDFVLKMITNTLKDQVRKVDVVSRYGGEEFVILLPETKLKSAVSVAEKLRKVVENLNIEGIGKITISLGISEFKYGDTYDKLFTNADNALYEAKYSGRNRIMFFFDNQIFDKLSQRSNNAEKMKLFKVERH